MSRLIEIVVRVDGEPRDEWETGDVFDRMAEDLADRVDEVAQSWAANYRPAYPEILVVVES